MEQNQRDASKVKNVIIVLLKIMISVLLLYYVFSKVGIKNIIDSAAHSDPLMFIVTAVLYLGTLLVAALRLRLLLPVKLSLKRLFSLSAIGSFFNMYVPSGIGGDIIKVYYLTREKKQDSTGISIPTALTVIFIEKYLGVCSLFFIGLIAYPFNLRYITDQLNWVWIFPVVFVIFFIMTALILKIRLGKSIKFLSSVYESFEYYRSRKMRIFYSFLYSLIIVIISVFYIYSIAIGLNVKIPLVYLFFITPLIHLVIMFPLTFAGFGAREGAFVILLRAVGVPASFSVSLSLITFLATAPGNLYGLYEYLRYRHTEGAVKWRDQD